MIIPVSRMSLAPTALLVLLLPYLPFSQAREGTEVEYCITRPEGERCYNVYSPGQVKGSPALLMEFHSTFGNKDDQKFMTEYDDIADDRGDFIIARPDAFGNQATWRVGSCCGFPTPGTEIDDKAFFVEMIEEIDRNYGIDRKRIYATGYSQGGAASNYLAYQLPEYIAAIATNGFPLSTPYFNEAKQVKQSGAPFRPVPVLAIHGYNDQLFCWGPICPTTALIFIGEFINARNGWKNWAELNGCTGEPITLSENPSSFIPFVNTAEHDDHQWIKAYTNCDGGVEVVQYLNSRNHSGEFIGTNGINNQETYSERIIDFLFRWTLLDTDDFATTTRSESLADSSEPTGSNVNNNG